MRILLLLGVAGLGSPQLARAQGSYRPGYIVQLSGDTVRGEVQLRGALRSATACSFRPGAAAPTTEYRPTELRAYGLPGLGYYEARRVPTPHQPGDTATTRLFLSLLARGRVRLYARRDQNDQTRFYLALPADTLQELRQYRRQVAGADAGQFTYQNLYPFRNVLAGSFRDCPSVQYLLPGLVLAATPLTQVVNRYNACVGGADPLPSLAQARARVSLGVVGGAQYSQVSFTKVVRMHNGNFSGLSGPVFGVFVAVATPSLNRHLAFRLDALYERLHYDDTYVSTENTTVPLTQHATFTLHYLRLPVQVRYYLLDGRVSPFLLAGVSVNPLLHYDTFLRTQYQVSGSTQVFDAPAFLPEEISGLDLGVLGGLGLRAGGRGRLPVSLEVRAEKSSGFLAQGLASPLLRVGALLSVGLTKE